MLIDSFFVLLILIFVIDGFRKGFISSWLSLTGYLGGGVTGFAFANRYTVEWEGLTSIIFLHLFGIFAGANFGKFILEKTGIGIHNRILFGPLKILNALLGAALSLAHVVINTFVIITLIDYLPWELPHFIIEGSKIYREIEDFNLLSFQISDLLKSTSLRWDQLRS